MSEKGRLFARLVLLAMMTYAVILLWDTELRFFYEAFR